MINKKPITPPAEPTLLIRENSLGSGLCTLGYICRALLALLCTLSTVSFFVGSIIYGSSFERTTGLPFFICISFIATVFFAIMGISRRSFMITGAIGASFLAVFIIKTKYLSSILLCAFSTLINTFLQRLTDLGFSGMQAYTFDRSYLMKRLNITTYDCMRLAITVITVLLAAIFCACILRRVRILPIIAVGSAIATIILYYGMNSGMLSFAMMLSSLIGVAALAGYDRVYTNRRAISASCEIPPEHPNSRAVIAQIKRKSSAVGGYMGLAAAALAMLLMLIPLSINQNMPDIPAISIRAAKLENYVIALLQGKNTDLGSLIFSGASASDTRSTAYSDRVYTGSHVFTVGSDIDMPIYLRSWVGTYYSGDSWYTPRSEDIESYKELFGSGFSPELLTYELLYAKDSSLVKLGSANYKSHSDLGYVTARVDIRKFRALSNLVYFPSFTDLNSGILEYGTRNSSGIGFSSFSDGIFSSTAYLFTDEYSTISNLPLLRDPDFAQNLSDLTEDIIDQLEILNTAVDIAGGSSAGDQELEEAYYDYILPRLRQLFVYSSNPANDIKSSIPYRYIFEMDDHERLRTYAIYSNVQNYRQYVYDTYLIGCEGFENFTKLARSIVYADMPTYKDMDEFRAVNLKVRKIIDYLSKNMVYTLTPREPTADRPYVNSAETFLFDTHEGYCVQYATAAVMLLRSLGIPSRYAEGYIVSDFVRDRSPDAETRYTSKVLDSNGHAWIEVYFDNYGWVLYEVTTPYTSSMYTGYIEAPAEETYESETVTSDTEPIETSSVETTSAYNESESTQPTDIIVPTPEFKPNKVVIAVFCTAAAASILLIILKLRAIRAEDRFNKLQKNAETSINAAKELNEKLFALLKLLKLSPKPGEQSDAFALRVDKLLSNVLPQNFGTAAAAIQRIEFSTSHSIGDVKLVSGYTAFLRRYLLDTRRLSTRLWRKYFLAI